MFIIDFNSDERKAFRHGFLKGLAAPVMLYHSEPAPKCVRPEYIWPEYCKSPKEAMTKDWRQLGHDLTIAIEHESSKTKIPR